MKALSGSANYTLAVDYPGVQGGGGPAAYSGVYGFSGPAGIYAYGMDWDPTVENAPAAGAYNPTDGTGAQGSILVGDYWNYKVQRFSVNGQHLDTYNDVTGPKANGGIPSAPYDIAADPTDQVGGGASFWAADQGSSNIVEFSHTGAWLQTIGKQQSTVIGTDSTHPGASYAKACGGGAMQIPTHVMVDTVFSTHYLYVSDPQCRNVYIFNHQGVFEGALNWSGSGVGTPIPRGIAEDAAGNIYVAEYNSRRIFVFNPSTRTIIASSAVQSDLRDVRGIALDPTNHLIYAVGAALNRVYEFSYDPATIASRHRPGQHRGAVRERVAEHRRHQLRAQPPGLRLDPLRCRGRPGQRLHRRHLGLPGLRRPVHLDEPVQDPGYRVLKYSPNDWTAKPSCNPGNATAQTTCAGATPSAIPWSAGTEPPPQGGFNQQNGIAVVPNDSEATGGADGLYVIDTFEQRVQKFDTNQTCSPAGQLPGVDPPVGRPRTLQPRQRGLRLSARAHLRAGREPLHLGR